MYALQRHTVYTATQCQIYYATYTAALWCERGRGGGRGHAEQCHMRDYLVTPPDSQSRQTRKETTGKKRRKNEEMKKAFCQNHPHRGSNPRPRESGPPELENFPALRAGTGAKRPKIVRRYAPGDPPPAFPAPLRGQGAHVGAMSQNAFI